MALRMANAISSLNIKMSSSSRSYFSRPEIINHLQHQLCGDCVICCFWGFITAFQYMIYLISPYLSQVGIFPLKLKKKFVPQLSIPTPVRAY